MLDSARAIFEEFQSRGYERITGALSTDEEGLTLDFKQFKQNSVTSVFRRIAVAFANSSGGVIVWGIDSRGQGANKPRIADKEAPVPDPNWLVGRLNDLANQIASYGIPGIQSIPIVKPGGSGEGFVVTLVPESNVKPHQAQVMDTYFYRTGSNTITMPHAMIEALVLAKARPEFQLLCYSPHGFKHPTSRVRGTWAIQINLLNVGRVPGRGIDCIILRDNKVPAQGETTLGPPPPVRATRSPIFEGNETRLARLDRDFLVYPRMETPFLSLHLAAVEPSEFEGHEIKFMLFAEGYSGDFILRLSTSDFDGAPVEANHGQTPPRGNRLIHTLVAE
ncbi:MAG: ATP-binding protein [Armatimonadetes bacterium]|nr:ATP-binding protein [Armatimonadota bacterium]